MIDVREVAVPVGGRCEISRSGWAMQHVRLWSGIDMEPNQSLA